MKLSVIVPVYNEERTIRKVITKLLETKEVSEIIIVNDGSTDNTKKELAKIRSKKATTIHKKNEGKGSAITKGLTKVTGDYVLIQDADLEYDPADIHLLVEPIEKKGVQVVYGSRFLGPHSNLLFWNKVGNTLINFIVNILYNTTLSDMETCYKLIPAEVLRSLAIQSKCFGFEPEVTCKLLKRGVRIYEVPISYVGRDHTEGKKITWKDGLYTLWIVLKLRFSNE